MDKGGSVLRIDALSYPLAFVATVVLLYVLKRLAPRIDLVDYPGGHRWHETATPLVGGLAMFLGFLFGVLTLDIPLAPLRSFFAAAALLIVVGVLDDLHELSSNLRFVPQVAAALLMVYWGGVSLHDLGALTFGAPVYLGRWAVPITVFAGVGVINALNMSDGMDGQAGGLTVVALAALALVAANAGNVPDAQLLILLAVLVAAFLLFNLRLLRARALVFMGDAGSMFLGFALAWFLIKLSQGEQRAMTPVTALWLLALPLFDTVGIMLRRILQRRSPFLADREHFHHLLLAWGCSVNQALVVVLGAALACAAVGLGGLYLRLSEGVMFSGFLVVFGAYFLGTWHAWKGLPASAAEGPGERRAVPADRRRRERRAGAERRRGRSDDS